MPSAPLIPFDEEIVGSNPYKPGVIVGTDPWSDISTANYTEVWASARPAHATRDESWGTLAPVPIPLGGTLVTLWFTAIFAVANEGGGTGAKVVLQLNDMDDDPVAFVGADGNDHITVPTTDGAWHTMDFLGGGFPSANWLSSITGDPIAAEPVADLLRAGCRVSTFRLTGGGDVIPHDHMLRTAYLVGVGAWTAQTPAPPWLLHPRRDNLGNSPQLFPQPDTRQRSNRISGTW